MSNMSTKHTDLKINNGEVDYFDRDKIYTLKPVFIKIEGL